MDFNEIASPTMTVCTTMSALTNMFHGDRLRGSSAVSVAANAVRENSMAAPGSWARPTAAALKHQRIVTSSTCFGMVFSCLTIADRLGRAARCNPVTQRMEALQLVAAQRAGLVAADEHLEHDAAIDIEKRDEGR